MEWVAFAAIGFGASIEAQFEFGISREKLCKLFNLRFGSHWLSIFTKWMREEILEKF